MIKITREELLEICCDIVDLKNIDIRVIRPPSKMNNTFSSYLATYTKGTETLEKYKSIIVYCMYSNISYDYYVRDRFTQRLQTFLLKRVIKKYGMQKLDFCNDYYVLRKELAVRAGLGRIGKNSLLFNNKFGFDCKIDMLATSIEFDIYDVAYEGEYKMDFCQNCSVCIKKCPMNAIEEYTIKRVSECDELLNSVGSIDKHNMCRNCTIFCPINIRKSGESI